jgi:2-polyprenyl-3-methyl-5-hydroxy-6-metoxy-1,4-benzoquinol methylase
MTRECHVRICERLGVKLPGPTRQVSSIMSQIPAASSNAAQIEFWNASAGETWAQLQEPLDRQIEPLGLAAIDVLGPREGQHIIDIGCGCGQTTLSLAARVGATGSVVGVDISKPMLEVALRRARPAPNLPVTFRQMRKPMILDVTCSTQLSLASA